METTKQQVKNEAVETGKLSIKASLQYLFDKEYQKSSDCLSIAQKCFQPEHSTENSSICLSLQGLVEYLKDKTRYLKVLTYVNDGKYLADYTKDITAILINEFVLAEIDFMERSLNTAMLHYLNADKNAMIKDEYHLQHIIKERISQLEDTRLPSGKKDPLVALLKIGQAVSAETNIDVLLKVIAEETKSAIQADRCSVFLYDKKNNELWSKVALGMDDSQEIRFPADKGLAGHVVKSGDTINIKDAYSDGRFNKEIDLQTGYKTKTILCMPIKNLKQEIIGAFQVLNKLDGTFTEEDEELLIAIGSSAGIALENAQLFKEQKEMFIEQKQIFESFIDTLAASIDARDKITAGHSTRVRLYSGLIARKLGLDEKRVEIIEKAATLHDIGKIGIRDAVLQKEGKLTDEEYKHIQEHARITHDILEKIHMSEDFKLVTEIACSHHEKYDGSGYYRHLKGEDIKLGGRILAVSDVFDAITSKRHYRDKMPIVNVIDILLKSCWNHFDGNIVDCFLSIPSDEMIKVFLTENNLVLQDSHQKILTQYTLKDLYGFMTQENQQDLTEEQNEFINLFQFYYTAKSKEEILN